MTTGSLADVAAYYNTLLNTNMDAVGLKAVYYGDQDQIPVTPAACVEPDSKVRELKRIGRGTDVNFTVYILLYHSALLDPQSNREAADKQAEDIEALIHQHERLEGLATSSLVTRVESGYSTKGTTVMRASRLTVEVSSWHQLPQGT